VQTSIRPEDEKYRKQEIADGLLIALLDVKEQERLIGSAEELERFWSEHREEYGWGIPHYRGMVIHCKDKKEAKAIKKYLRKYPMALWEEALRRRVEQTGVPCKFESGCYRIGENPFVDKLAFKCGSFVSLSDYPYTWILGEKLKKGPESMNDVKEKVEKGYRELMKSTEINRLRQKYSVEINEEVLKTVNNEGNN
jgi:peptidyl-prolyl cis-trans isomerase SurA